MKKIKRIVSCIFAIMMLATFVPPDTMKVVGIEVKNIYGELSENDINEMNFESYFNWAFELNQAGDINQNNLVWSAQHWFNFRYCKIKFENQPPKEYPEFIIPESEQYSDDNSYSRIKPDGHDIYDTMYAMRCALQVELINYGCLSRETVGTSFGSFGPATQAAYDKMSSECGGLEGIAKKRPDVIRIIHYALAAKGYSNNTFTAITPNLAYSDGTLFNISDSLKEMIKDCGLKDIVKDPVVDFNSLIFKSILTTDSYVQYEDGDKDVRKIQQELNAKTYDQLGIAPCDGIYSRDTNERMIHYYQELIFNDNNVNIEPNGHFGKSTLKYSPTITPDSKNVNLEIFKLIKWALYINSYNHIEKTHYYDPFSFDNDRFDSATKKGIHDYKTNMSFADPDDNVIDSSLIASLMCSDGNLNRSSIGCDARTPVNKDTIKEYVNNGYKYIGRYIADKSFDRKRISREEAELIISNGLSIIPIYQGYNTDELEFYTPQKGEKDARDAVAAAEDLGIPQGSTIYFALDVDTTEDDIKEYIVKYFKAISVTMATYNNVYKVGMYGNRNACQKVYDAGYAVHSYVSDASSGFSGNMGFNMPTNWTFDQFGIVDYDNNEFTINGTTEIDKVAVSQNDEAYCDFDPGVRHLDNTAVNEFDVVNDIAIGKDKLLNGSVVGDPVDLASGAHQIDYTAASVSGAQTVDFTLEYSSQNPVDSEMGMGWNHNYEKHLEVVETIEKVSNSYDVDENDNLVITENPDIKSTSIYVYDSPSSCKKYISNDSQSNVYVPDGISNGYSLNKNEDNSWTLNCDGDEWYYFDAEGTLTGHKNKEGMLVSIKDTDETLVITEAISRKTITAEKKDGKIVKVYTDNPDNGVIFEYSGNTLAKITDRDGNIIKYTYDSDGRVLSGTDGENITYFKDTYYDHNYFAYEFEATRDMGVVDMYHNDELKTKYGRIKTQDDALGNTTAFDYKEEYISEEDGSKTYKLTVSATDRNKNTLTSVFDINHLLLSYTDQNGIVTTYNYDQNTHDLLSVTDPSGNIETMKYDENHNVISKTDKTGLITNYSYDTSHNVTEIINLDKNQKEISKSSYKYENNLMTEMTDQRGNITRFIYTDGLLTKKIINEETVDEKIYTYEYKDGLLVKTTDPCGNSVKTAHSSNGFVESVTDSNGNKIKENTFDKSGHIITENIFFSKDETLKDKLIKGQVRNINHTFNSRGLELKESDNQGTVSENIYNGNGKIISAKDANGNAVQYEYDAEDRLISVTDSENNKKIMEYDAGGRIIKETDAEGIITQYQYNTKENIVTVTVGQKAADTDEINIISQSTSKYDGNGNILWKTDAFGTLTEYQYNEKNLLYKTIFAKGKEEETCETYEYNKYGDLISVTDGEGNTQTYEYDKSGNKISVTDANGNQTAYTYDKCGNLKTEANAVMIAEKKAITYNYDSNGRLIDTISPSGNKTTFTYDFQGRLLTVTDPLNRKSKTVYDLRSNTVESINNNNVAISTFSYDSNNNLLNRKNALGYEESYKYDKASRLISVVDAQGNETTYKYDKTGKLTETKDALSNTASASYDALGNMTNLSDSGLSSVKYKYDSSGNVISKQTTSDKDIQYGYNSLNLCTQIINARNQKTTYSYDKAGRIKEFTQYDPEGNEINKGSYTYDKCGNILTVTDNSGTITRTFDSLNRMSSYTDTFGNTVKYHYDIENNLKKIEYPDDKATKIFAEYSYDNAGQLLSVKDWKDNVTKYSYDKIGNLAQIIRPDESVESYVYDEAGNLKNSYDNKKSGDSITSYTYKYSENGDLIEEVSNHENTVYSMKYDGLGRMICRTRSDKGVLYKNRFDLFSIMSKNDGYMSKGFLTRFWASDAGTTTKEIFGYDASGNIQAINNTINENGQYKQTSFSKEFSYGKNNQLLSYTVNNGKTMMNPFLSHHLGIMPFYCPNMLMYDDDGNVTSIAKDKKAVSIGYDVNNRLTLYGETNYTYDAEGNRIKKETGETATTYLYDTSGTLPRVLESKTGEKLTVYIYGKELISQQTGDSTEYYHYDYRGSTVALTDKTGNVTDRYSYDVYGNGDHITGTEKTPFQYTGSCGVQTDENGLMYMCTRYYNPEIMRFLSADVLTGDVKNTQSLNRYAYCQGNPISFTDPFGMSPEVRAHNEKERAKAVRQTVSLRVHNVLDVGGMFPVAGAFADGTNGMIYLIEGDMEGVAFSAIAFIPVIGQVSTPAKYLDDGAELTFKYGDDAAEILWNADDAYVLAMKYGDEFKGVREASEARKILNVGAGDNPIPCATNIDINPLGDGVQFGDANNLSQFTNGQFDHLISLNPYKYNPLESDMRRVLKSGGNMTITGGMSNKYFNKIFNVSPEALESLGYEVVSKGDANSVFLKYGGKVTGGNRGTNSITKQIILRKK